MRTIKNHYSNIFWVVLLISVTLNVFLVTKCYYGKPTWTKCKIVVHSDDGEKSVPQDVFLGKAVDFYQSLLNYQIAFVGIILVLGFISSYHISRRQIRDTLDEELYSKYFEQHYLPQITELVNKLIIEKINDNEVVGTVNDLATRLDGVEKDMVQFEVNPKPTRKKISKKATDKKKQSTKKIPRRKDASDGND